MEWIVSEELSSVETPSPSDFIRFATRVSEELSSVETEVVGMW